MESKINADENASFIIEKFTHAPIEKIYRFKIREENLKEFQKLYSIFNGNSQAEQITKKIRNYQYCQIFLNILTWKIIPSINFEMNKKKRNLILNHDKVLTNGFVFFWNENYNLKYGEKLKIKARFLNIIYDNQDKLLNPSFLTKIFNSEEKIICKIVSNLTMFEGSF